MSKLGVWAQQIGSQLYGIQIDYANSSLDFYRRISKTGFIYKRSLGRIKLWKRRCFRLHNGVLSYTKKKDGTVSIPMIHVCAIAKCGNSSMEAFKLMTGEMTLTLRGANRKESIEWFDVLNGIVSLIKESISRDLKKAT